jgi:hypothetical protein
MGKQFTPEVKHVFLKPNEAKFIVLMTSQFFTDHKETAGHPWNAEAKRYRAEMYQAASDLKKKLQKLGFDVSDLDEYREGDENEFLTPNLEQ